jgi:hypothetical protein
MCAVPNMAVSCVPWFSFRMLLRYFLNGFEMVSVAFIIIIGIIPVFYIPYTLYNPCKVFIIITIIIVIIIIIIITPVV